MDDFRFSIGKFKFKLAVTENEPTIKPYKQEQKGRK
jgi:hypothetical protein